MVRVPLFSYRLLSKRTLIYDNIQVELTIKFLIINIRYVKNMRDTQSNGNHFVFIYLYYIVTTNIKILFY